MNQSDFIKGWINANDSASQVVAVQIPFIRMLGGNANDAILLSQILFWNMPSREGQTKLRVKRDGELWLAKGYKDWEAELGINEHTARKSIGRLKTIGLIETRVMKFGGNPTVHIRMNWDKLEAMVRGTCGSEGNDQIGHSVSTKKVKTKRPDRAEPYTEITDKEQKTEITHTITTTTEQPIKRKPNSRSSQGEGGRNLDLEKAEREKARQDDAAFVAKEVVKACNDLFPSLKIEYTKSLVSACLDRNICEALGAIAAMQERISQGALRRPAQYLNSAIKGRYVPPRKWIQYNWPNSPIQLVEYLEKRWAEELAG